MVPSLNLFHVLWVSWFIDFSIDNFWNCWCLTWWEWFINLWLENFFNWSCRILLLYQTHLFFVAFFFPLMESECNWRILIIRFQMINWFNLLLINFGHAFVISKTYYLWIERAFFHLFLQLILSFLKPLNVNFILQFSLPLQSLFILGSVLIGSYSFGDELLGLATWGVVGPVLIRILDLICVLFVCYLKQIVNLISY